MHTYIIYIYVYRVSQKKGIQFCMAVTRKVIESEKFGTSGFVP